jgi:hypothetical protein
VGNVFFLSVDDGSSPSGTYILNCPGGKLTVNVNIEMSSVNYFFASFVVQFISPTLTRW